MLSYFFSVLIYLFTAYCLMVIAEKTNTSRKWFAFIPILNFYLMCKIAGKSVWWVVLLLIPLVNIVALALVGMKIAERLGKPRWIGLLLALPLLQLVSWGYLAFTKSEIVRLER